MQLSHVNKNGKFPGIAWKIGFGRREIMVFEKHRCDIPTVANSYNQFLAFFDSWKNMVLVSIKTCTDLW